MAKVPPIEGHVAPGYEAVKETFANNFRRGEIGASVCVYRDGECVVDIWGGVADKTTGARWEKDTLGIVFSSTKGLAAIVGLVLADQGALELDRKVADYWPEFAKNGKADITVRTLLNHRGALMGIDQPIGLDDLEDLDRMAAVAAEERPAWAPDTKQGYHAISWGMYAQELFRRASGGRTIGQLLQEYVAGPVGADAYLGMPDEHEARVARLYPADTKTRLLQIVPRAITGWTLEGRVYRAALKKGSPTQRALSNPSDLGPKGIHNFDTPRVRKMELAWANAISNARGLAQIYARLIGADGTDGNALVKRETWEPVTKRQSWQEPDSVLLKPMGWSQGFVKDETRLFSPNEEAFGHPGAGGGLGWADPTENLAIGYVMNGMDFHIRSPRAVALAHSVYDCIRNQRGDRAA